MKMKMLMLAACLGGLFLGGCNDDDDPSYLPDRAVVDGFTDKYPTVQHVTWEKKNGYSVADFYDGPYQAEAWFDTNGAWMMTETDLPFAQLPAAVRDSFARSAYADWKIDDVDRLERPATGVMYVIEVEKGREEYDLFYSETGILIRAEVDTDGDEGYRPVTVPQEVYDFVATHYAGSTVMEVEKQKNGQYEIDILDGRIPKEITLDASFGWIRTEWDVLFRALPEAVKTAVSAAYPDYRSDDDADAVDTPDGLYYEIELEKGDREIRVKFRPDGQEIK